MVQIESYNFPDELYYSDRHIWVRKEPDGLVTIGYDDLAQKLQGRIMFTRLPKEGTVIEKGKQVGTIESMKWVERLRAPVSGVVKEMNKELRAKPRIINEDPYGAGWFLKLQPTHKIDEELNSLYHGEAVKAWVQKEIQDKVKKT